MLKSQNDSSQPLYLDLQRNLISLLVKFLHLHNPCSFGKNLVYFFDLEREIHRHIFQFLPYSLRPKYLPRHLDLKKFPRTPFLFL